LNDLDFLKQQETQSSQTGGYKNKPSYKLIKNNNRNNRVAKAKKPDAKDAIVPTLKKAKKPDAKDAIVPTLKKAKKPAAKDAIVPTLKKAKKPDAKDAIVPTLKKAKKPDAKNSENLKTKRIIRFNLF
jgi:hypothetical protein